MKRYFLPIAVVVFVSVLLSGFSPAGSRDLRKYKQAKEFFGTYVSIECFYDKKIDIEKVTDRCWRRLKEIHASMNSYSSDGDVARINDSGFYGVQVRSDVYKLLDSSLKFSRLTGGAFDVTVSPLVAVWKNAAENGQLPLEDTVQIAKNKVGYTFIQLERDNTVFLKKKGMKIDLGAIAKGYAVDEVARILEQNGVKNFLIDAGGDIYCRGLYDGKTNWTVGVQDPTKENTVVGVLKIKDAAVTTSGDYERFYTIGSKKFSHIIDPNTGYPQETVISVTVIAAKAFQADAFSTALCIMGSQKGIPFVDSLQDVEAMIVENVDGEIVTSRSKGYEKYM